MGRKKKKKQVEKTSNADLFGLFIILLSVIGIFNFGKVGFFLRCVAMFFAGKWYLELMIINAFIGVYMLFKNERPKILSFKSMGLIFMIVAALTLTNLTYKNYVGMDMIKHNFSDLLNYYKGTTTVIPDGGGMIGSIFCSLSTYFLDGNGKNTGTMVISITFIVLGFAMFTGLTIKDIVNFAKEKGTYLKDKTLSKKDKIEISKAEDEYEEDDKVIVSSIDELTHPKKQVAETVSSNEEEFVEDTVEENTSYSLPPLTLLNRPTKGSAKENEASIKEIVPQLENVLANFDIQAKVVAAHVGPAVTQYELEVKGGTKLNRILNINREIALALAAKEVRIEAPIPGKSTVGIEIPNRKTTMVTIREVLAQMPETMKDSPLAVVLGRDIMGNPQFCKINKTPHLLIAGSTGSGKSVCINCILTSILMRTKPDQVKLVLIDPKKVELAPYNGVPHLLAPVVADARKANIALKKMVAEMERRYDMFEETGTKNIEGYNAYVEKKNATLPDSEKLHKMPFIVIVIDELADLMMVAAKEVQDSIMRITQMARAAGMHLIVATQRPSTDVITGVVKANIPSRISFAVSSGIDSRTILDQIGAEKLLGKGDMLFLPQGENTPMRIQGAYVDDSDPTSSEMFKVINYTINQQKAKYDNTLTMDTEEMNASSSFKMGDNEGQDYDAGEDPLYAQAVEFVIEKKGASTSSLQRRFRIGYNRAACIIDKLEERGIVGPANGSKPRKLLVEIENDDKE